MGKYKNKYRIEAARHPNWDYSSNGAYYVTICTKNMELYFGDIKNGEMDFTEIGKIAHQYFSEIPDHFPFVKLGEFVVMPNHVHGIAFSFKYGMEIMEKAGINANVIRAGKANMFLSPVFRETLAEITGATIEPYNTDGSIGAARGAGIGCGFYKNADEAFKNLKMLDKIKPKINNSTLQGEVLKQSYHNWLKSINNNL